MRLPLTRPCPAPLSEASFALKQIEARGIFSNFGPVNTSFETEMVQHVFAGQGHCTTVCNATLGLMLAVRAVIGERPQQGGYALMPAFTFAAAAQAALWCGLTPLFCDISPTDWASSAAAEEEMIRIYGKEIAVIMPYATFGYDIDLKRYETLQRETGIPVVVDAAASLGTKSKNGAAFGTGSSIPIVFSMHATKPFATGEGGVIYCADSELILKLKQMSNFGFGKPRNATMAGLNAKLSEVAALQALLRLRDFEAVVRRRQDIAEIYRRMLPELSFQPSTSQVQAHQFASALLPARLAPRRAEIQEALMADGIGMASYFSPHLGEQDYFRSRCVSGSLSVTQDVAARIISLPLYDTMKSAEVMEVVTALRRQMGPVAVPKIPATVEYHPRRAHSGGRA